MELLIEVERRERNRECGGGEIKHHQETETGRIPLLAQWSSAALVIIITSCCFIEIISCLGVLSVSVYECVLYVRPLTETSFVLTHVVQQYGNAHIG